MEESFLTDKLERRKAEGTLRKLPKALPPIDFVSNDYLGLARNGDLQQRIEDRWSGMKNKELGGTGSRLLSGNHVLNQELEASLRGVFRSEATLVFNSGYNANLALLSCIPQKGDVILYDEWSHACLKDGARLSMADRYSFKHNDLNDLKKKLQRFAGAGKTFVVTESLFSMDGDFAPLAEMIELVNAVGGYMVVDEAHSTGTYGPQGGGYLVDQRLEEKVFARVYTFGKAIGAHGACIAGSQDLIDYLINFSRPFIYTTALPPHTLLTLIESFRFLADHQHLQQDLQKVIVLFRELHVEILKKVSPSNSAIQPIWVQGNDRVIAATEALQDAGFAAMGVRSPTVPKGLERLRICLHQYNTEEEITSLLKAVAQCIDF